MLIDRQIIIICYFSMFCGSLLVFLAWMNLFDASGAYAKILVVLLITGFFMFFIGFFTLLYGDFWINQRKTR